MKKQKPKKFTFKTKKATGRYRSFYPDTHIIKMNKKLVGYIGDQSPYKIRLAIKKEATKEGPANFKWITLVRESKSLIQAKMFLCNNVETILEKFDLHLFED